MQAVLRLRRDSEYGYNNRHSFIPMDGEVCLVNTNFEGLRAKIGDGRTQFKNLKYVDFGIVQKGYYHDGKFYADSNHQNELATNAVIYIDKQTRKAYYYDNDEYVLIHDIPMASSSTPGLVKLYDDWDGLNDDGAVTQRALRLRLQQLETRIEALENQKLIVDALNNEIMVFKDFNVEVIS